MNSFELSRQSPGRVADSRRVGKLIAASLAAWAATVIVLSSNGLFESSTGGPPLATLIAIVLPLVCFALVWNLSPVFRDWVNAIDLRSILLLHTWRMLGLGFIFVYAANGLPGTFAFPAGLGDAAAAAWATWLLYALIGGRAVSPAHLRRWNAFGLADFVIAVTLGTLSRSGQPAFLSQGVTSDALGALPLSLVPTFAVPFFVITHICVLLKLRREAGAGVLV